MLDEHQRLIAQITALDFAGKGEAFVEAKFLSPLLQCLGYEAHKDYEVLRHGDDGAAFKLRYPPVEKGALRARHYHPDYIPTVRKKMFWIIEAKSPKETLSQFDDKYLMQGVQYCVHPDIQAKYLLLTNGLRSAVYDVHGSVFLGKDPFKPILEFQHFEIPQRWEEIYDLLSVEMLRVCMESDLKAMYDKMCLSSLDPNYPHHLLERIGASRHANAREIRRHVDQLGIDYWARWLADRTALLDSLDAEQLFARMEFPPNFGRCEAMLFVERSLNGGRAPNEILAQLTHDFGRQSIFRKLQCFIGVCHLYRQVDDAEVRTAARHFLEEHRGADLPLLNQAECALLRLMHKVTILKIYPDLQTKLNRVLRSAPELVRFVQPRTPRDLTYPCELLVHQSAFEYLKGCSDDQLRGTLRSAIEDEVAIEADFQEAHARSAVDGRQQILAFESLGVGGKEVRFGNIMRNFGIELGKEPEAPRPQPSDGNRG
jgi:hypothetical protein